MTGWEFGSKGAQKFWCFVKTKHDATADERQKQNIGDKLRPHECERCIRHVVQSAQNQSLFGHQFHFHLLLFINYMQL